jgi:hypothetical protein
MDLARVGQGGDGGGIDMGVGGDEIFVGVHPIRPGGSIYFSV